VSTPLSMAVAAGHASLPVSVLTAVLLAAVLHASWNAIAHAITDRLVGFALIGAVSTACGAGFLSARRHRPGRVGRSWASQRCCTWATTCC